MDIGLKIRKLRREKNLTLVELGEKIGIKGQGISNYESGSSIPPIEKIEKLAAALGTTVDFLLSKDENEIQMKANESELIEELRTTMDFLKKQIEVMNAEKAQLSTMLELALRGNFLVGNTLDAPVKKLNSETEVITLIPAA